jgi:hypothetical protein
MVFLAFFGGVGLVVPFRLPARVFRVLAPALAEKATCLFIVGRSGQNWDSWNGDIIIKARNGRDEVVQCLYSDKRGIRFQEHKISNIKSGVLPGLFPPRYGKGTPARQSAS